MHFQFKSKLLTVGFGGVSVRPTTQTDRIRSLSERTLRVLAECPLAAAECPPGRVDSCPKEDVMLPIPHLTWTHSSALSPTQTHQPLHPSFAFTFFFRKQETEKRREKKE